MGGPGSPKEGARDAHRGSLGVKKKRREGREKGRKKKKKERKRKEEQEKKRSKSFLREYLSDILRLVDLAILGIESSLAKNVDFDSIINLFAA